MSSSGHPWLRAFAFDDSQRALGRRQGDETASMRPGKKFLTFRPAEDPFAPTDIWAQVSDPTHFMACRFLAAAVTHFRRSVPPFADLTSLKGSILLIKAARTIAWPYPIPSQVRNSPWANTRSGGAATGGAIVLEVSEWKVLGCTEEAAFWEDAQEVISVERRRRVKIEAPVRDAAGHGPETEVDTAEMQGQALRHWLAESHLVIQS